MRESETERRSGRVVCALVSLLLGFTAWAAHSSVAPAWAVLIVSVLAALYSGGAVGPAGLRRVLLSAPLG